MKINPKDCQNQDMENISVNDGLPVKHSDSNVEPNLGKQNEDRKRRTARTVYMERCMKKKMRKEKQNLKKQKNQAPLKPQADQQIPSSLQNSHINMESLTQSDKQLLEKWKNLQGKSNIQPPEFNIPGQTDDIGRNNPVNSISIDSFNQSIIAIDQDVRNSNTAIDASSNDTININQHQGAYNMNEYDIVNDPVNISSNISHTMSVVENHDDNQPTTVEQSGLCLPSACIARTVVISPGKSGEKSYYSVPSCGGVASGYGLGYNIDDSFLIQPNDMTGTSKQEQPK